MSRAALLLILSFAAAPAFVSTASAHDHRNWRDRHPPAVKPVPEIDAGSGLAALSVLACGLALIWERRRPV